MSSTRKVNPKNRKKNLLEFTSIRTKLLVIVVVILIAAGSVLTGIAALMATNALEQAAVDTLDSVGASSAKELKIVNGAGQDLIIMSSLDQNIISALNKWNDGTLESHEQIEISEYLAELTDTTSDLLSRLYIVDNNGIVIASNIQEDIGQDYSHFGFFTNQEKEAYIADPFLGTGNVPYLAYARPVYDASGKQIGLASAGAALAQVEEHVLSKYGLSDDSVNFLVGPDGTIYSGVDGDYSVFLTKKFDLSIFPAGTDMVQAPGYYGRMSYITRHAVPETDWLVITTETVNAVSGPITNIVMMMVLSLIIVIIIGALATLFIAKGFVRPIQALTDNAQQLAVGDVDVAITHTGIDEIGQLADSFRAMAANTRRNAETVSEVATGNVNFRIDLASDKDLEGKALIQMKETLSGMVESLQNLAQKSAEGDLSYRSDASQFQGVYQDLIQTLNQAFDLIIDPVQETMRLSQSYSSGDYSDRFDPDIEVKGDFIPFKTALNRIGINTSQTLLEIRNEIQAIAAGTEEASGSIEDVTSSVAMLAESSSRVSSFAERNDVGLDQSLTAMNDLADTVGEVAQRTSAVSELASQASNLSYDGIKRAEQAGTGMKDIMKSFEETSIIISEISSQMEEIGGIVDVISGIAEQTSLLALNAAIEAARAGDAGLGFAVVADEVKSLAQESQTSAEHIGTIIGNLQKKTSVATEDIEKTGDALRTGNNAVNETITIFNQMTEAIGDVNKNMSEVAAASEEQAASVEEITASMSEVRDMVRDTAKEATDSAAASEEISAAVDQVNQVVAEAAQGTMSIVNKVSVFKIE